MFAGDGGHEQQRERQPRVEDVARGEGAAREQQRVAGQERRDDQPGLREDDGEQDGVDPRTVRDGQLGEVCVEVDEQIDQRVHREADSRPGDEGSGRPSAAVRLESATLVRGPSR